MARQRNDGRGRLGGRTKGTPNKITASVRDWLAQVIDSNRGQMETDLTALEPKERLQMLEKFMQYVIPKQQAVSASIDIESLTDSQLDELVKALTKDTDDETSTD